MATYFTPQGASPATEPNRNVQFIGQGQAVNAQGYFRGSVIPWLFAIAVVIGILFLVAVATLVLAAILIGWMNDSHYTAGGCRDGDQCTKGLKLDGGCQHLPRPDGHKCDSQCFYPEDELSILKHHECQYHQYDPLTGQYDPHSICTGTVCKGECEITADCPNITFSDSVIGTSEKLCASDACYYRYNATGLNDDIDAPCTADSVIYHQVCLKKLNMSDPIVQDNCLDTVPVCEAISNATDPVEPRLLACDYFFRCACPVEDIMEFPIVRGLGTQDSPTRSTRSARDDLNVLLNDIKPEDEVRKSNIKGRARMWQKRSNN